MNLVKLIAIIVKKRLIVNLITNLIKRDKLSIYLMRVSIDGIKLKNI